MLGSLALKSGDWERVSENDEKGADETDTSGDKRFAGEPICSIDEYSTSPSFVGPDAFDGFKPVKEEAAEDCGDIALFAELSFFSFPFLFFS